MLKVGHERGKARVTLSDSSLHHEAVLSSEMASDVAGGLSDLDIVRVTRCKINPIERTRTCVWIVDELQV